MTAIDASVTELTSSSLVRSLLGPASPGAEFALFAAAPNSADSASAPPVESSPSTPSLQQLACYDAPSDWFPSDDADREALEADRIGGAGSASDVLAKASSDSSRNWLAGLSVEVRKVDGRDDGREDDSVNAAEASSAATAPIDAATADWDESVFFDAADAAAAAVCCAVGSSTVGQAAHGSTSDGAGRLDVLLGNPNLHHSSPDLLELDVQNCCTVDFPMSPKQLLVGVRSSANSRSSSSSNSSSSSSSSHCGDDDRLPSSGASAASPPPTPSPGSSVGSGSASSGGSGSSGGTGSRPALSTQPCSMCSKVFTSTSALAKHKLTHSDERRFSCQLCGKAFKRQDHLNGHLITHREKKPFECRADGCGKSYCDARSLRRHQDNHHASGNHSPPGTPLLGGLSSNTSTGSPAALFISELSAGSTDLLLSASSSANAGYPASNSSSGSGSHAIHFNGPSAAEFASWTTDAADQLESCIQFNATASAQQFLSTDSAGNEATADIGGPIYWTLDQVPEASSSKSAPVAAAAAASAAKKSPKQAKIKTNIVAKSPAKSKSGNGGANKFPKVTHVQPNAPKAARGCHKRPSSDAPAPNNDGLTNEQLELIQQIMRQTQEQHRLMQQEQQQQQQQQQQIVQQQKTAKTSGAADQADKPKVKKSHGKAKWSDGSEQAATSGDAANASGRPVECNVCQRRFKNTPALNGHMRLHGGFLKKDADCSGSTGSGGAGSGPGAAAGSGNGSGNNGKKVNETKKDPNNPPLLTASVSIRALIEEKIIQRRNNLAAAAASTSAPSTAATTPGTSVQQTAVSDMQSVSVRSAAVETVDASNVLMMDVLGEADHQTSGAQSQPLIPKLEPESYFEGSLLALSPVSLHRALEGDMEVHDDEANHAGGSSASGSSSLAHLNHGDNFFNTSSSSGAGLNDPLLDDSVFHQVSAAAASALLSDISSLDLQSYMDTTGTGSGQVQQTSQSSGSYSDLSQYLANAVADASGSTVYQQDGFQSTHQSADSYVYQQNDGGLVGGFGFDPSPSTPLSSLCSPQHYLQPSHHYGHQADYSTGGVDASGGFQSMLAPSAASPYTPSPSPVSPAVSGSSLPHLQRYQGAPSGQGSSSAFYSTSAFGSHATANFMLDCGNMYNMDAANFHSSDLTTVSAEAISGLMDQPEVDAECAKPSARIKKPRAAFKHKRSDSNEPDGKKRKYSESSKESRDPLPGPFLSSMRPSRHSVLLDPKRSGPGLFCNLVTAGKADEAATAARCKARIRVGKDYQCPSIPRCKKKEGNKEKDASVLCWSGEASEREMAQVERFLAWTRSGALTGSKRSEEHVLSVLNHFNGDIQAAKWHLLTQQADPDNWTPDEIAAFQAAILQNGKDFTRVAQHVPSKTLAQCVQFYYVWKKVCRPQEYAAVKARKLDFARNLMDDNGMCEWRDADGDLLGLAGDVGGSVAQASRDACSTPSVDSSPALLLLPSCEFADCPPAISTNSGRRRHGNRPLSESSAPSSAATDKLYPCSVCNKVFDKVKSRSAHMKTHKSAVHHDGSTAHSLAKRAKVVHKSPLGALAPSSPSSTTSQSSTSCSLPSPFLPSQSLF